jgi:hypothetical protein
MLVHTGFIYDLPLQIIYLLEEFSVLNRTVQRLRLSTSSVTLILRENVILADVLFVY